MYCELVKSIIHCFADWFFSLKIMSMTDFLKLCFKILSKGTDISKSPILSCLRIKIFHFLFCSKIFTGSVIFCGFLFDWILSMKNFLN